MIMDAFHILMTLFNGIFFSLNQNILIFIVTVSDTLLFRTYNRYLHLEVKIKCTFNTLYFYPQRCMFRYLKVVHNIKMYDLKVKTEKKNS